MNEKDSKSSLENVKQSVGTDSKSAKRNSGLFSFFKWLKSSSGSSNSRESLNSDKGNNNSSSCESLSSLSSSGTVASFSFVDPNTYSKNITEKNIKPTPETDTYKERLKQRDKRREKDKNTTLRQKYNLFFNRDTTLAKKEVEENTKSLPLMTKPTMKEELQQENFHRRTNSDSSKFKKAGAYLHVKGKRKAPQPPGSTNATLKRRSKRLAPSPPPKEDEETPKTEQDSNPTPECSNSIQEKSPSNDILKLDNGFLKPVREEEQNIYAECSPFSSPKQSSMEPSKLWYKRHETKREFFKETNFEKKLPEVQYNRTSTIEILNKKECLEKNKKDEKRKSGVSFLTNISELDREAAEILQKEKRKNSETISEIPEFMKLKEKTNTDSWKSPKRSARDLIAKFNAITNVTKVTVNTALFGTNNKDSRNFFGKSSPKLIRKHQEALLESHKKRIEQIDKKLQSEKKNPLLKSESAVNIVKKSATPKNERKSWYCPKCYVSNEYWRIICRVCSSIKPYFDDLTIQSTPKRELPAQNQYERVLERSKTQIGFTPPKSGFKPESPIPTNKKYDKKDEKEKLKRMLIEMKNSLPKKPTTNLSSRIITEKPGIEFKKIEPTPISDDSETSDSDNEILPNDSPTLPYKNEEKKPEETNKEASVIIGIKSTIYENIKVRNSETTKVSSSSQTTTTSMANNEKPTSETKVNVTAMIKKKNSYEPMKIKDFEDIYSDQNGKSTAKIYASLAQNDELSLFFNGPKNLTEMKNTLSKMKLKNRNKDTIEINRLLRRLEVAIAKGDLTQAADFAKELAQLKVNCSVVRQKSTSSEEENDSKGILNVDMYVEDKVSHRGPFPLKLKQDQTVGQLKKQVEKEFEIPAEVQRWILGKELANNDEETLTKNGVINGCSIFLYLVTPSSPQQLDSKGFKSKNDTNAPSTSKEEITPRKLYPEIDLSMNSDTPKIVNAVPKPVQKNAEILSGKQHFNEVVTQTVTTVLYQPKIHLAEPENVEEYDVQTLKPQKEPLEWECHLCTLLNPQTSNICGVCATVRLKMKPQAPPLEGDSNGATYAQLMNLDQEDLVHNNENFECVVCFTEVKRKEGVTLRECLHQFCRECLRNTIEFCEEAEVKCPYRDEQYSCNIALQDREIKALVSKESYDNYLAKSITQAENKMDKSFHCKTPDCKGWCIFEDNVNDFKCPVCRRVNCLTCQAIHMGLNCKQYQQRMIEESEIDENARQTREMLDEMVRNGEALKCPTCHVVMMKKWGCDWLRCSMCKTEICWVTRGPRWGPDGKGDTSGGCKCGVNGVKCHPKCNYCH